MKKLLSVSIAMALAMAAQSASAVDFTGYFRSGVGINQDGGQKALYFGNNYSVNYVGRLGNEYDTYTEIGLGQEVYNKGGVAFRVESMISASSNGTNDYESTTASLTCSSSSCSSSQDAAFALRQFNVQAKGLIAADKDAVVWVGKRYYQRHDLHIIDSKYWNISGAGAGLENLSAGPGKASFAIIRGDTDMGTSSGAMNVNYLDARYAGLKPWDGAWIEFGVDYALVNKTDAQETAGTYNNFDNSLMLTGEISQYFASTGMNQKVVLQYANKGLAHNVIDQGGGWYDIWSGDNSDAKGYRFINTADIPMGNFAFNYVLTLGKASDYADWVDNTKLVSLVGRLQYQWTDITRTEFEAGTFNKTTNWTSGTDTKYAGQKYTIAQAWAAGRAFLSRPEIRVYASYLTNDGDTKNIFNSNTSDHTWNFGVQAEAWW